MSRREMLIRDFLVKNIESSELDEAEKSQIIEFLKSSTEEEITNFLVETEMEKRRLAWPLSKLAEKYATYGLEVSEPKANTVFGATMVCCPHDGVPYCMDAHPTQVDRPNWTHGVKHRALMIERHHDIIKAIYQYCQNADIGDVWVLSGGGMQLQAFFGNSEGYLGILYLTLEDLEKNQKLQDNGYLQATGNETYTFSIEGENDLVFRDMVVAGVKVRTNGGVLLEPRFDGAEEEESFGMG